MKIILNFLVYVYCVLKNASDCFIIEVDEEFKTLVITAIDDVFFYGVAQGLVSGGTAVLG